MTRRDHGWRPFDAKPDDLHDFLVADRRGHIARAAVVVGRLVLFGPQFAPTHYQPLPPHPPRCECLDCLLVANQVKATKAAERRATRWRQR